jgi:hypothetical protein
MAVSHSLVRGTVTYVTLEGGFWGILGDDGQRYRPVSGLPPQWQKEGKKGVFTVQEVSDISIFMWGQAVRVLKAE